MREKTDRENWGSFEMDWTGPRQSETCMEKTEVDQGDPERSEASPERTEEDQEGNGNPRLAIWSRLAWVPAVKLG